MNHYPLTPGYKTTGTSKEAATAMQPTAGTVREEVLNAVKASGRRGMTADEAATWLGYSVLTVRPRFSELKTSLLIIDSGLRRKNTSGINAIVWVARDRGTV